MSEHSERTVRVGVPGEAGWTTLRLRGRGGKDGLDGWRTFCEELHQVGQGRELRVLGTTGFPGFPPMPTPGMVWTAHEALDRIAPEQGEALGGWLRHQAAAGQQPFFCDPECTENACAVDMADTFEAALVGVYASAGAHAKEVVTARVKEDGVGISEALLDTVLGNVDWEAVAQAAPLQKVYAYAPLTQNVAVFWR